MSKNTRWTSEQFKKQGLIETPLGFVKAKTLVAEKVIKIKLPPDYVPISKVGILKADGTVECVIKPNAKIRNATKSVVDGVSFDSNLERTMYNMLTAAKIDFQFQATFILQEKFRYRDENIRAIVKIVDFWLPTRNIIIDTKGFSNDVSPMKHKMLKLALQRDYRIEPDILMPKNKKECDMVLNRLLYGKP